ncbi:hypothetical protein ACN42_g5103 [Penicillium freii]|uniref:Uncharacterized protein n=1 Tax=Penicillium freii TaxID=48697 RepID=A0A124GRQ4_PENFR|nr:hypothetical protein ACN42_g5103 [Penicillium freii]
MQWNLTRITIMQGAGEDEDSDIDSGGDSVAVTSGSRSPIKEARMFPERLVPISPRGSPSKGTSSLTENVLTENVPYAHRPIMPPGLPMPPLLGRTKRPEPTIPLLPPKSSAKK